MERAVAIKKLSRLLGKNMGYRIEADAPTKEERMAARAELSAAVKVRTSLDEACQARLNALLAADSEYQSLKAARDEARERAEKFGGIARHYKIRVGVSNSMFFTIEAEGDSWEDVISQIESKKRGVR